MDLRLRLHPLELPLARPYRWAKGVQHTRSVVLVEAGDGSLDCGRGGPVGWGECAPPPHDPRSAAVLAEAARAWLPSGDGEAALADLRCPDPRLRAGFAGAILDLLAQARGVNLAQLLADRAGLARPPADRVPVNALVTAATPAGAAAEAVAAIGRGFRTLKIKCGAEREVDLARIAAIRQAAPRCSLRLDANESWSPEWALAHLEALAPFGVEYVEQPLPAAAPDALARLAAASPVAIALDESATDVAAIAALLDAGAGHHIILKPQRLGGLDQAVDAVTVCADRGVGATVTNSLESAVGLTGALHVAALLDEPLPDCGLGTAGFLARDVAAPPPAENGWMDVPAGPGLGIGEVRVAAHMA